MDDRLAGSNDRLAGLDDRLAGVTAVVVGVALAAVGTLEYVVPGVAPPPFEPIATGVLVTGSGVLLAVAGGLAVRDRLDNLALKSGTGVGLVTLALAVLQPDSLLFGGVFWLALVAAGLVTAGVYRTIVLVRAA